MGDRTEPLKGPSSSEHETSQRGLVVLALGIVFGDIGTSPLYALHESVEGHYALAPTPDNVIGVLSLVVWALILVVTLKYLVFIMRADNHGEGGILSLLALVPRGSATSPVRIPWLARLVIFGAALLYGDGIITPAISVLSAIEGLEIVTSGFDALVVPLTVLILLLLFWAQRRGTAGIGRVFGPIMALWFCVIAVLGIFEIVNHPGVLRAINPYYGVRLFVEHGWTAFPVLGSVVLTLTGAEALYADMGHFGRRPIRFAWFAAVLPALFLNYMGQGALLIRDPSAKANPFYALVPQAFLIPMVVLATMATIIASQALISGAYSLTRQAVQLGYFPRVTIVHTSKAAIGQIYVPEINFILAVLCIALVIGFRRSASLAAAYGIAVTGTMIITTIVYFVVITRTWKWPLWRAVLLVVIFLFVDVAFFAANVLKFLSGGWVPIAVAAVLFLIMTTWKRGRRMLADELASRMLPMEMFLDDIDRVRPPRVPGMGVFLSSNPDGVPVVLLHHFKHNKTLHERIVMMSVLVETVPEVPPARRVEVRDLGRGLVQVKAHYGFMETPNVPRALGLAAEALRIPYEPSRASYFLGRETLLATGRGKMRPWRKTLFAFISRNARSADQYFCIPPDRVVEIGVQIGL